MPKILQDVADVHYGKSQNGVSDQYGRFPIIGTGGFLGNARVPLFSGPAVVVGRKGTLDNPIFVPGDFWAVDTTFAVIPKENIHAKWLYFSLCNSRLALLNEATGVPSISRDRLYRVLVQDIDFPEQAGIAYVLDTIDEAIAKTEAVIAKLKQVRAGLLHDLLSYGLDENGQLRDPIGPPEQFKDSPLGRIPREWDVVTIKEIASIKTGEKDTQDRIEHGAYPFYVRSDVVERINSYSFDGEAILTAGDGVGVGKVVHYVNGRFDYHQRVYNIHNFSKNVCGRFLYYFFKENFYSRISGMSAKTSVDSVRMDMIANMNVPLFSFDEQAQVANTLSNFEDTIVSEQMELKKLLWLKSGIQDDLLTGRVRVPETIISIDNG